MTTRSMIILILAAGEQLRWGTYPIKQLLPVGDTTIIDRVCQQVKKYSPIVVTHRSKLGGKFSTYCPTEKKWTVETLRSTYGLWHGQVVVLLGDVIYSKQTLDKVLKFRGKLRAFGNPWEIFALSFQPAIKFNEALLTTIDEAKRGVGKGTLRHFFRVYIGTKDDINNPHFEVIDHMTDYTNDVDSPEEYENFLRDHLETALRENP